MYVCWIVMCTAALYGEGIEGERDDNYFIVEPEGAAGFIIRQQCNICSVFTHK